MRRRRLESPILSIVSRLGLMLAVSTTGVAAPAVAQETTSWMVLSGEQSGDDFGYFVQGIGRFDGDDVDDFMVSAPSYGSNNGRVYVYYGGSTPNSTPDLVLSAIGPDRIGYAIGAADFNGDGFRDALVGFDNGTLASSRIRIYFGGNPPSGAPGRSLLAAPGGTFAAAWVVASGGDLNEDGLEDVVANAVTSDGHGQVLVYYGRAGTSGPDLTPDVVIQTSDVGTRFGEALAGTRDITGDGNDDLAVGDAALGRVYVFRGTGAGISLLPTTLTLPGPSTWIAIASGALSTVPGRRDLIVSKVDPWTTTSRVYVYHGGSSWNVTPDVTYQNTAFAFGFALATTRLYAAEDKLLIGAPNADPDWSGMAFLHGVHSLPATQTLAGATHSQLGWALAGGVDVNGDGRGDYLVGAPTAGSGQVDVRIAVTGGGGGKDPPYQYSTTRAGRDGRTHLLANAPEPFSSGTRLRFALREPGQVSLRIFDLRGRLVREFGMSGAAGEQWVTWDGRDGRGEALPDGVYFVRLQAGTERDLERVTLIH
jgi:hypothetical protein